MFENKYILLGVKKGETIYCGTYNDNKVLSLNTGEIFYSIKDFVEIILGLNFRNELEQCFYYDDIENNWKSISSIIVH